MEGKSVSRTIYLFNGPPRSGKDTAVEYLAEIEEAVPMKMATPLKVATHALFGFLDLPDDAYEDTKDTPLEDFFGGTPRQSYIDISEKCIKPVFGKDFFGRVAAARVSRLPPGVNVAFSDSGFVEECEELIYLDNVRIILIKLYRDGCDFSSDSRSYLDTGHLPEIAVINMTNNGPIATLYEKLDRLVLGGALNEGVTDQAQPPTLPAWW